MCETETSLVFHKKKKIVTNSELKRQQSKNSDTLTIRIIKAPLALWYSLESLRSSGMTLLVPKSIVRYIFGRLVTER